MLTAKYILPVLNLTLCGQLTYDAFRNDRSAAEILGAPRLNDNGFEQGLKDSSMIHITDLLQPDSQAKSRGYKVCTPHR